jgi:hypothetical protein
MRRFVAGMLVFSATACAVPIPGGPEATPATTITDTAAVTPRDGAGAIVVTRQKQLRDMGCTYDISLDDRLVAELRAGEQVTLYADPGQRIVGVSIRRDDRCEPAIARVPLQVVASATTRIRVRAGASYDLKIEATTY